jgi:flagellar assembly protein FliH
MTRLALEDFGARPSAAREPAAPATPPVDYDAAYSAGWDDAMAQVDGEQGVIAHRLADRLKSLELDRSDCVAATVRSLEPLLHEVFDKLLPHAAERGFLALLLDEIQAAAAGAGDPMTVRVSPEEAPQLTRLLGRAGLGPDRVTVAPEPALALSQALLAWEGRERAVDLSRVLAEMDAALDDFLASILPENSDD